MTLLFLRRLLLAISVAAAAWWGVLLLTGGFVLWLGSIRISSRNPEGPASVAIVTLLGAVALLLARSARCRWGDEWIWWNSAVTRYTRPYRVLLSPAVAVAIAAAYFDLAQWLRAAPFWVDEEMIAINIRDRSLVDLAGPLWLGQSAPLAWLMVQRLILVWLGAADVTLRFLPVLFGVATVAVAVWIGRRWLHPLSAVLLVLLCASGKWLSFFRFEMKHYSADAFWALLLPGLAAWALESNRHPGGQRRWTAWWVAAAVGQFFSNGGLLVAPLCAVVVMWTLLRDRGARTGMRFAATGLLWVAAAAANYQLSLQYTLHSEFLRGFWASALPPEESGILDRFAWAAHRFDDLARDPAGTSLVFAFWVCALCGFTFSRTRSLGLLFASAPLTAFLLGILGLVPLRERISLWIVPALYVGIALLFDAASTRAVAAWRTHRSTALALGVVATLAPLWVSADIIAQGKPVLDFTPRTSNHGLDDRTAVQWVMDRKRPGDAVMTTHLGWPALWWYGGISLATAMPRGQLPDGSIMYEAVHEWVRPDCTGLTRDALQGRERVVVHVGFPDMPEGFYELILRQLAPFGTVNEFDRFGDFSRTAIVTLHEAGTGRFDTALPVPAERSVPLTGCATFRVARRW